MKIFSFFLCILLSVYVQGQIHHTPWMQELIKQQETLSKKTASENSSSLYASIKFATMEEAFKNYWKDKDRTAKGSGYKQSQRFFDRWRGYVNADGYLNFPDNRTNTPQIPSYQEDATSSENKQVFTWQPAGLKDFENRLTSYANIGRVNKTIVSPHDPKVLYVTTPGGGVWKSENEGKSWFSISNGLPPGLATTSLAVDPGNPDILYVGTGDVRESDLGDGLYKSTDGGNHWFQTGIDVPAGFGVVSAIWIHPKKTNTVLVAYDYWEKNIRGVYRSTNGGKTFEHIQKTKSAEDIDIIGHPTNPQIIYLSRSTSGLFMRSNNGGKSFKNINFTDGKNIEINRLFAAVSKAAPDQIYLLAITEKENIIIYKSVNQGDSFKRINKNASEILNNTRLYVYNIADFAASDQNPDELYFGSLNLWQSKDGGRSFKQLNQWNVRNTAYTHADIMDVNVANGKVYCATDGGIFQSTNSGKSFTDLTLGLRISTIYHVDIDKRNSINMAFSTQDNACFARVNKNDWYNYGYGDGFGATISNNNSNRYYGFPQLGSMFFQSEDGGRNTTYAIKTPPGGGRFFMNMIQTESGQIYALFDSGIHRLEDGVFIKIPQDEELTKHFWEIAVHPKNNQIILASTLGLYVGIDDKEMIYFISADGGKTFTEIADSNLVSTDENVFFHSEDPSVFYLKINKKKRNKIYKYSDYGATKTDITYNLPTDIYHNVLVHQEGHPDNPLFLGTDDGRVYRFNETKQRWRLFSNGLPRSSVRDLAIDPIQGTLIAGTYGSGIWQINIPVVAPAKELELTKIEIQDRDQLCDPMLNAKVTVTNKGLKTLNRIRFTSHLDSTKSYIYDWKGTLKPNHRKVIQLPRLQINKYGTAQLHIKGEIIGDTYLFNNQLISENEYYIGQATNLGRIHDFEDSTNILKEVRSYNKDSLLWEVGIPKGNLLNKAASGKNVLATNLDGDHPDGEAHAYLMSGCMDLTTIKNPWFQMTMAYDLEKEYDVFYVEYTLDGGNNWSILGTTEDPNWYNSDYNYCEFCVGNQWNGTNTELTTYSYNLAAFAKETNFLYRLSFKSDSYTTQEGVVIDDLGIISKEPTNDIESADIAMEKGTQEKKIQVTPTLIQSSFNVTLPPENLGRHKEFAYSIKDLSGRIIEERSITVVDNQSSYNLVFPSISKGIYIIRVNHGTQKLIKKIIKN